MKVPKSATSGGSLTAPPCLQPRARQPEMGVCKWGVTRYTLPAQLTVSRLTLCFVFWWFHIFYWQDLLISFLLSFLLDHLKASLIYLWNWAIFWSETDFFVLVLSCCAGKNTNTSILKTHKFFIHLLIIKISAWKRIPWENVPVFSL